MGNMEVKLCNGERLQGSPLRFDVINNRDKVVAQIEVDCDVKDLDKAQEQAFVLACQMHLKRFDSKGG